MESAEPRLRCFMNIQSFDTMAQTGAGLDRRFAMPVIDGIQLGRPIDSRAIGKKR